MEVKEVCRLCLNKSDLVWVFDERLESVKYMKDLIFTTTGVEINKDDVISQNICTKCGQDVIKLYQFREQSLKNDKFLRDLQKKSLPKKTMHVSVVQIYNTFPGLKLPNLFLDLDFSPMVEMEMDEVENYFKSKNIDMNKHLQLVMKTEKMREKAITQSHLIPKPNSSISPKETVSPISIKFRQDNYSYEIVHKPTCSKSQDGSLQNEIISLISSSPPPASKSGNHRKRKISDSDLSSPSKKPYEPAQSGIKPIIIRRKSMGPLNFNVDAAVPDKPISNQLSPEQTLVDLSTPESVSNQPPPAKTRPVDLSTPEVVVIEDLSTPDATQITPSVIRKSSTHRSPEIISNILLKPANQLPINFTNHSDFTRLDNPLSQQTMPTVLNNQSVGHVNSIMNADVISKPEMQSLHPIKCNVSLPSRHPQSVHYPTFSSKTSIHSTHVVNRLPFQQIMPAITNKQSIENADSTMNTPPISKPEMQSLHPTEFNISVPNRYPQSVHYPTFSNKTSIKSTDDINRLSRKQSIESVNCIMNSVVIDKSSFQQVMTTITNEQSVEISNSTINERAISKPEMQSLHPTEFNTFVPNRHPQLVPHFRSSSVLIEQSKFPTFSNKLTIESANDINRLSVERLNTPVATELSSSQGIQRLHPSPVDGTLPDNQLSNSQLDSSDTFSTKCSRPVSNTPLRTPFKNPNPNIRSNICIPGTRPLNLSLLNRSRTNNLFHNKVSSNTSPIEIIDLVDETPMQSQNSVNTTLRTQPLLESTVNRFNDNIDVNTTSNIFNIEANESSISTIVNGGIVESIKKPTVVHLNVPTELQNGSVGVVVSTDSPNLKNDSNKSNIVEKEVVDIMDNSASLKRPPSEISDVMNIGTNIEISSPQILPELSKIQKVELTSPISNISKEQSITEKSSYHSKVTFPCKFCRGIFESEANLNTHFEKCFSKKAIENPPEVLIERIENDETIARQYSQAFMKFQKTNSESTYIKEMSNADNITIEQPAQKKSKSENEIKPLSDITPDVEIENSQFPHINDKTETLKFLKQLLVFGKNQCPGDEKNTQTQLTSKDPQLDKLKPMFKRLPRSDSILSKIDNTPIEMENFRPFLDIYKIPVFIENGERLAVKYNFKNECKPKKKFEDWSDLTPIDVKIVKTSIHSKSKKSSDDIQQTDAVIDDTVAISDTSKDCPKPDFLKDTIDLSSILPKAVDSVEHSKFNTSLTQTDVQIVETSVHSQSNKAAIATQHADVEVIDDTVPTIDNCSNQNLFEDGLDLSSMLAESMDSVENSKLIVSSVEKSTLNVSSVENCSITLASNSNQQINTEIVQAGTPVSDSTKNLEFDIDLVSTVDLSTETLKKLLESVNTTISKSNNHTPSSDSNVNDSNSTDLNFPSDIDESIIQLLNSASTSCEPVVNRQLNNENHAINIHESIPGLGITIEDFDSYIPPDVSVQSIAVPNHTNISLNVGTNAQLNVSKSIPSLPYTSPHMVNHLSNASSTIRKGTCPNVNPFINQKYHNATPGSNSLSNVLAESSNPKAMLGANTPTNSEVNMSYEQYFQNFIKLNVNVYNPKKPRKSANQVKTRQVWNPPAAQLNSSIYNKYSSEPRPPPPPPYNARPQNIKNKAAVEKLFQHISTTNTNGPVQTNTNGPVQYNPQLPSNYNYLINYNTSNGYNSSNNYNSTNTYNSTSNYNTANNYNTPNNHIPAHNYYRPQGPNNINLNTVNHTFLDNSVLSDTNYCPENYPQKPNNLVNYRRPVITENVNKSSLNRQYGAPENSGHTLSDSCNSNPAIRVRPISDLK